MENITAPGIEEYVIKGIEDRLTKYFGVRKTLLVSSSDRMSRLKVIEQNKDLKFPICFLMLRNGEVDATYNARSMRRNGVYTDVSTEGTHLGKVYAVPTLMTFDVVLTTDSFVSALKFFKLWILAATAGSLNFDISYDNTQIPIVVQPANSIAIPTRDVTLETPNFFEFEGSIVVHGYVSPDHIGQTPLIATSVITAKAVDDVNNPNPV